MVKKQSNVSIKIETIESSNRHHRYVLSKQWSNKPMVTVLTLYPSSSNLVGDDITSLFHIKDSYSRGGNKVGVIKQTKGTYRAFFFRDEMEKVLKKDFSISNIEKALQLLSSQNKLITDKRRLTKYLIIESNRIPMYCIELPTEWKKTAMEFGILREY